jgi:hypothetical protein
VIKDFNDDVFIWTEAYNCGEILNPMISSYIKNNKYPINVFGTKTDLAFIETKSPLVVYQNLKSTKKLIKIENQIMQKYRHGHKGTAELWNHIINYRPERYFLHLDSDTIFLSDVITDLIKAVKLKGYSLAGSRRPYLHRTYRKTGQDGKKLDKLPDVVNTDCFIFDKRLINTRPYFYLKRKIAGRRPIGHPVVDFFDPVSFEIISKGGLVLYMDTPDDGNKSFSKPNSEFHNKRISFAAVGSGLNFYKNPSTKTSVGYRKFAISSYALFAKWLLNKDIGVPPLDAPEIVSKLKKLNQEQWTLE